MPPDSPALGAALDLLPWQVDLLSDLSAQMDALKASGVETVPPVALLTIVRYLDEIDLSPLLVGADEAAAICGVSAATIGEWIDRHPEWMTPLVVTPGSTDARPGKRLWLRRKVEAFARLRKSL